MEELENTLNSNNPILIAQIFSKIIKNVKEERTGGVKDSPELRFLKEKCIISVPTINEVAGEAIINLVKDGVLPIEATLADFITSIPLTKCYGPLIKIIGNLLYLDMETKATSQKEYINNYNLWLPQHPFITILNESSNTWYYILNEIKYLNKKEHRKYVSEIFRSFYLYALCNPTLNGINLLKQNTWNFILCNKNLNKQILMDIFCLMQVETKNNLEANTELLNEAINDGITNQTFFNLDLLILWQASLLYNLAINKQDLRPSISCITNILEHSKDTVIIDCLLLIVTKIIPICSSVYLLDLLNLCNILLAFPIKQIYILEALKASLLQWLASPSLLTSEANNIANTMFMYIENYVSPTDNLSFSNFVCEHRSLINTNKIVFTSVEICLLLTHFAEENNVLEWIEKVEQAPNNLIMDLYEVLCGLFLSKKLKSEETVKIATLILKYVETNKMLSSQILILILYKLSNTEDSKLHFILLRALPRMVVLRDNIPKVMAALLALSKGSADLYNFSLSLMFNAWKVDNKCYSHLESMLMQHEFSEKKWETYITKSYILKELCLRKPELYGKELVAHLSKILNECKDENGSLPCAIAIDGIRLLCKSEVIDVVTTWATLAPKFRKDSRVPVIKSLCALIHEIPHLPYTELNVELQQEVVKTLWDYVQLGNPEVTEAALNSLTSFGMEQICSQLPEQFLDDNALQDRKGSVVGVPQVVPGKTWIKFLIENRASKEAGNFLIKMISIEIEGYLKYVYQVKGHREPINYDYLPSHSIVRGIGDFIKTWVNKWKHSIHDLLYIECLRILSQEYSKPLPPLDWCFLQELFHDASIKNYCIDIASHQAILSGTARRLMENYIVAVTNSQQEDDIVNVLRNLKHLANSIQPLIIKPFFVNALAFSINKFENDDKDLLEKILGFSKDVLINTEIQETNKLTIAEVLNDKISSTDIKSELFTVLLNCVIALPKQSIEEITNLKSDVSEEWLERMTKIRCFIAFHTNVAPLVWLSDIIEICSTKKRNNFIIREFITVFRKHINNPSECALWLLELIGQIQAKVAERCDEKEMLYYFDILILTVVEFSGFSTFITDGNYDSDARTKELFPQAFNSLLCMNDWSVCTSQALEWLYHMNVEETVPSEYRNVFGLALWSLRHDEEFIKNSRWMKYLSSKVQTNY